MTIAKARAVMSVFMIRLRRLRITVADASTGRLALSRKVGQAKEPYSPDC